MISPVRLRAKASGFTRISVRSIGSFAVVGVVRSGARARPPGPSAGPGPRSRLGRSDGCRFRLLVLVAVQRRVEFGQLRLHGSGGAAAALARRRGEAGNVGFAVGADRPRLVEWPRAVHAPLLELAQAARATYEVGLDPVVAVRAERLVELVQPRLGRAHLQLALV